MRLILFFYASIVLSFNVYGEALGRSISLDCNPATKHNGFDCRIYSVGSSSKVIVVQFSALAGGWIEEVNLDLPDLDYRLILFSPYDTFDQVGRFYFLVINMQDNSVIISGFTDSPTEAVELDGQPGKELIIKSNIDPRDNFPIFLQSSNAPYISIYSWGCSGEPQLVNLAHINDKHGYLLSILDQKENERRSNKKQVDLLLADALITSDQVLIYRDYLRSQFNLINNQRVLLNRGIGVTHHIGCFYSANDDNQ